MSSTEPPSRIPPREGGHESKAARDELSSKGKVEKVREVDPDEETRKKKFLKFYKDGDESEETVYENRPTPFDLYSQKGGAKKDLGSELGEKHSNFGNVENAIIPDPSNTPPPNVGAQGNDDEDDDEDTQLGSQSLPQSDEFWEDLNMPDQPLSNNQFQENSEPRQERATTDEPTSIKKKKEPTLSTSQTEKEKKVGDKKAPHHPAVKMVAAEVTVKKAPKHEKEGDESSFTAPAKTDKTALHKKNTQKKEKKKVEEHSQKKIKKEKIAAKERHKEKTLLATQPKEILKENLIRERRYKKAKEKHILKEKEQAEAIVNAPIKPEERELSGGGGGTKKEHKTTEIESPSMPTLPRDIQPMAQQAATQAAHILSPPMMSLFFQMVGTIYIAQKTGVNKTEIVLNNPSYSGSKFFGSKITIVKYASAPDSFNIKLTGSNEAVRSFKENIPSLLTAFENNNLPFKINRLDVEYTADRPVFRRKEKSDKGEAGGGDLGEQRR